MSFLSKSYQIDIDITVERPGHGTDLVDRFNAVHKRYLTTRLIMHSTPEVEKIGSKRMRVHVMTKNGKVRFSEEFKRLLEHCDEIVTKGDHKHAKRDA